MTKKSGKSAGQSERLALNPEGDLYGSLRHAIAVATTALVGRVSVCGRYRVVRVKQVAADIGPSVNGARLIPAVALSITSTARTGGQEDELMAVCEGSELVGWGVSGRVVFLPGALFSDPAAHTGTGEAFGAYPGAYTGTGEAFDA